MLDGGYKMAKDILPGETVVYDAVEYAIFAVSHTIIPGYTVFTFANGAMLKEADLADIWVK